MVGGSEGAVVGWGEGDVVGWGEGDVVGGSEGAALGLPPIPRPISESRSMKRKKNEKNTLGICASQIPNRRSHSKTPGRE